MPTSTAAAAAYIREDDKDAVSRDLDLTSLNFNRVLHRARERYRWSEVLIELELQLSDATGTPKYRPRAVSAAYARHARMSSAVRFG
jgi:hypothetical protein